MYIPDPLIIHNKKHNIYIYRYYYKNKAYKKFLYYLKKFNIHYSYVNSEYKNKKYKEIFIKLEKNKSKIFKDFIMQLRKQ